MIKRTIAVSAVIGLMTVLSAGNAWAVTTFNFASQANSTSGSAGNSLSMTSGGITVTETAWWVNTSTPTSSTVLNTAAVMSFNGYGLGSCNGNDYVSGNCSSPNHQMDNQNGVDFLLLLFSTPVNISNLTLLHSGAAVTGQGDDADFTYWTRSAGLVNGSTTFGSLGTGTTVNTSISCSSCDVSSSVNLTNVTYLLIAAAPNNPDSTRDAFKLKSLDVTIASTPEPGSIIMLGSGLLACAEFARRRRKALSSLKSVA